MQKSDIADCELIYEAKFVLLEQWNMEPVYRI